MHIPEVRLRHLARQIHNLGPRPLAELFIELEAGSALGPTLERYARLSHLADFVAANDGDRIARPRLVAGGQR